MTARIVDRIPGRLARVAALALVLVGGGAYASAGLASMQDDLGVGGRTYSLPVPEQPNVLLILADDIGVDRLAVYAVGANPPSTPVLDQLAADGVLFRSAWAHPICSPTRAAIQTGRSASASGVGWNTSVSPIYSVVGIDLTELTLPEMLAVGTSGAYRSAAIGKWHLGHTPQVGDELAPNVHGYEHFAGTMGNLVDHFVWERVVDGVAATCAEYALSQQVDDALAWIGSVSEPWFCYVAFNSVHAPLHDPPDSLHSVDLSATGDPGDKKRLRYAAMVEAMDTELGRLLDGVDLDETVVIFVGDNGTSGELLDPPYDTEHGKGTLYESGLRVPLVVRAPGIASPGSECAALVQVSDLYATIAQLAGVDLDALLPPGTELDSISLVPYVQQPSRPSQREHLTAELFFPNGPGAGEPFPLPDLGPDVCQEDLGLGGPGTVVIELCGGQLTTGNDLTVDILGGPPLAAGALLQSITYEPQFFGGGIVVALSSFDTVDFTTDVSGDAQVPVHLLEADAVVYLQAVLDAPGLPGGYAISNALEAHHLPINLKAARNRRYKLIDSVNGGPRELYDLRVDPYETDDLLDPGPLSPAEQAALAELAAAIDAL